MPVHSIDFNEEKSKKKLDRKNSTSFSEQNLFDSNLRNSLGIRIRIWMILGLPDPNPLVCGMDLDPARSFFS
jgi:hypothetical protein